MKKALSSQLLLGMLVFFMIVQAILGFQLGPLTQHAFSATPAVTTGYTLSSFSNFTQYGQIYVNETFSANSSSTSSLSSLTLGFPGNYSGHMIAESATDSFGKAPSLSSASGTNNTLLVTLGFPTALPAHTAGRVSLSFWVINTYAVVAGSDTGTDTNYTASALFYPSINTPIDSVSTTLWFPYPNTHVGSSAGTYGFTDFVNASAVPTPYETWSITTSDSNYTLVHWAEITMVAPDADSGNIEFTNVQRTISVGTGGQFLVTDKITLDNLGQNTLTSIAVNLLTNATSVTNIPATIPPLNNEGTASITNGEVSLTSIDQQVEPNSSQTFIIQYPLSSQYRNASGTGYVANIPGSLPVQGLTLAYSLVFSLPTGYVATTSGPMQYNLSNTVSGVSSTFGYKSGIGSAFSLALPLAAVAFIGTFVAAIVFKPRKENLEEKESAIDAMLKAVEDKVSGTNEIVSELRAKGTSVSRLDLSNARTRIDELRAKSASRLGNLRAELIDAGATSQATLNEVALNDREFDRAIKDLINSYEQFIARKMKPDTFAKLLQSHEHRIQRITNNLLDELQDLRHEYEQEQ